MVIFSHDHLCFHKYCIGPLCRTFWRALMALWQLKCTFLLLWQISSIWNQSVSQPGLPIPIPFVRQWNQEVKEVIQQDRVRKEDVYMNGTACVFFVMSHALSKWAEYPLLHSTSLFSYFITFECVFHLYTQCWHSEIETDNDFLAMLTYLVEHSPHITTLVQSRSTQLNYNCHELQSTDDPDLWGRVFRAWFCEHVFWHP